MKLTKYSKPLLTWTLALGALLVNACAFSTEQDSLQAEQGRKSSESVALQSVLNNGTYVFPDNQKCLGDNDTTVSLFLTNTLLELQGKPAETSQFEVQCQSIENKEGLSTFYSEPVFPASAAPEIEAIAPEDELSQCSVSIEFAQGEVVWSKGVQVLVNSSRHSIIPETLRCIEMP